MTDQPDVSPEDDRSTKATANVGVWNGRVFILEGWVCCGCVEEDKHRFGGFNAYGCVADWKDVSLGSFASEDLAKAAVQKWAEKNDR
jgi:hypothetical protein